MGVLGLGVDVWVWVVLGVLGVLFQFWVFF